MALTKCPECGREISDKAQSCPGCGAPVEGKAQPAQMPSYQQPVNQPKKHGCIYYIVITFIILVVLGAISRGIQSISKPSGVSSATSAAVAKANKSSPTIDLTATIIALTPSATPSKTPIPTYTFTPGPTITPTVTYTPSPRPTIDKKAVLQQIAIKNRIAGAEESEVTCSFTAATENGDMFGITTEQSAFWSESSWLTSALYSIQKTTPLLFISDPELGYVIYELKLPGTDAYGNKISIIAIEMIISRENSAQINWENVNPCNFPLIIDTFDIADAMKSAWADKCSG
jgi:hypothetical protein